MDKSGNFENKKIVIGNKKQNWDQDLLRTKTNNNEGRRVIKKKNLVSFS